MLTCKLCERIQIEPRYHDGGRIELVAIDGSAVFLMATGNPEADRQSLNEAAMQLFAKLDQKCKLGQCPGLAS